MPPPRLSVDVPGLEGHVGCGRGALRPNADLPIYSTSYLIYAQVAKGVAAIMLRNKLKVPDALAQATTAGGRDPPKGFDRKIVHGHLKLVARDGAVASRADDAYAAAASMEADTSLTPTAALDAARAARDASGGGSALARRFRARVRCGGARARS